MPTAVGPNTKGEENLVFGYDLGDISNSYKGEPTTNINNSSDKAQGINSPNGNRNFAGIAVTVTPNHYYSAERPHVVRLVCTVTGSDGYKEFAQQSSGNTSGSTYVYSFDYKFIIPNDSSDGTMGTPIVYGNGYKNPDSSGRQANTSVTNTPLKDGWIRRSFKYDATYTGNNYYRTNVHSNGYYYEVLLDNFQIEEKSHATPFTAGTRSATQGLLDLTGNSTIDLTNVSFDSSAQPDWDGSSDFISAANSTSIQLSTDQSHTLEYMLYMNALPSSFYATIMKGSFSTSYGHLIHPDTYKLLVYLDGDSGVEHQSTYVFQVQKWIHVVTTFEGGTSKIYIDGELDSTQTGLSLTTNTNPLFIGSNGGVNYYLNGKMDSTKIYNRALTASEIKSNYNAIKGRFNI